MITVEFFAYTDAQWNTIKVVIRDALNVDADQIERPILSLLRDRRVRAGVSFNGMVPLRSRIETTLSQYHLGNAINDRSPRRNELERLREDAENMRASILDALTLPFDAKYGLVFPVLLNGVDDDMLTATSDYFRKLASNLNRQIKQAGTRTPNAKIARDQCWNELLAIWCELGGERSGHAAASFLHTASQPVMNSAVPDIPSIMRWLKRRQRRQVQAAR